MAEERPPTPLFSFEGRTAVVTGAGGGIGRAVALLLARCGCSVACVDANGRAAEEAAAAASEAGGASIAVEADVREYEAVERAVGETVKAFGRLDFAVANAGIVRTGSVLAMSADEWRGVLDVNCTGVFNTVRACGRAMVRGGGGGRVVTVSSANAVIAQQGAAAYCGSKAALAMMTRCWAQDLLPYGITVNCVGPGATDTPLTRAQLPDKDAERGLMNLLPTGRMATSDEVAQNIAYFCTPHAEYVTGSFLLVDGGLRDHEPSQTAGVHAAQSLLREKGGEAALAAADEEYGVHVAKSSSAREAHGLL